MEGSQSCMIQPLANYEDNTIFHACLVQGKKLADILNFLNGCTDVVVLFISKNGLVVKADNRPLGDQSGVQETIFASLFIPSNGFQHWFVPPELDSMIPDNGSVTEVSIPVAIGTKTFHDCLKGPSVLVTDSILLYIKKDDPRSLYIRVTPNGQTVPKVETSIVLIDEKTLPATILKPLEPPPYDILKPITTFVAATKLGQACKDAKKSKVEKISIDVYAKGIVIHFSNSQLTKNYIEGTIDGKKTYTAVFKVSKIFEYLPRCVKLSKNVNCYAIRGLPMLFNFLIGDTGGYFRVYFVADSETN